MRRSGPGADALATPVLDGDAGTQMRADALFFGCLVAVTAAAFTFGADVLDRLALDRRFRDLDADIEWNVLSWLGSAAFLTSAVAAALLALALRRALLAALALGLALLSLDELLPRPRGARGSPQGVPTRLGRTLRRRMPRLTP